jgi:dTDP-4-dehydrorhamnose reductase
MKSKKKSRVLVLGAQGMLGHTVFNYLGKPNTVFGTIRNNDSKKNILTFNAHEYSSLDKHIKQKQIDYIINCIGILPENTNREEMKFINAEFPHKLAEIAKANRTNVIHISTDAVFSPLVGEANENTIPSPINFYGNTKFLGEPLSSQVISIRTSILGLDKKNQKGLLEWALKEMNISGYTNQVWSGSTSLQLAQFCEKIINNGTFKTMRYHSPIFHFSPILSITKHDIIKTFLDLSKSKKKIKKAEGERITRILKTNYPDLLNIKQFESDLKIALRELITFEKTYAKL